jgi:hypothetical protein
VHQADRDGGRERRRRVTRRKRCRRRDDPDRIERRIGERRAWPVERLLEDRDQERSRPDREQPGGEGARSAAPAGGITTGADGGDQRPLDPPRRSEEKHDGQRSPAQRLGERGRGSVETP